LNSSFDSSNSPDVLSFSSVSIKGVNSIYVSGVVS